MGALKQQRIGIPHYCRRCKEILADGQMVCPFCDNDAMPLDEAMFAAAFANRLAAQARGESPHNQSNPKVGE